MCGAHCVRVVQERGGEKGRKRRGGQGRTAEEIGEKEEDTSRPKGCQISCLDHTLEGDAFEFDHKIRVELFRSLVGWWFTSCTRSVST
jgi:hypothetical protein